MKIPSETCADVRSSLPLYVGGELEPDVARTVESHLAQCGACRVAHERAARARDALGTLRSSVGPAPELWPGVRGALVSQGALPGLAQAAPALSAGRRGDSREAAALGGSPSAAPRPTLLRRLLPLAAAAALVALVALRARDDAPPEEAQGTRAPVAELEAPAQRVDEPLQAQFASEPSVDASQLAGGLRRVGVDEPRLIEQLGAQPVTVPVYLVPGMRPAQPGYERPASYQPAGNFR